MRKYLFFDTECANSRGGFYRICEIGYVITDKKFRVLEDGHILINPDCEFDKWVLKHLLSHTKQEYIEKDTFDKHYDKIKSLFTEKGVVIVGHSTKNDKKYLRSCCKRYNLEQIDFKFRDIKKSFHYLEPDAKMGLDDIVEYFNIDLGDNQMHDAYVDAYATMLVCKALCKRHKLTINQVLFPKNLKKDNNDIEDKQAKNTANPTNIDNLKSQTQATTNIGDIIKSVEIPMGNNQ